MFLILVFFFPGIRPVRISPLHAYSLFPVFLLHRSVPLTLTETPFLTLLCDCRSVCHEFRPFPTSLPFFPPATHLPPLIYHIILSSPLSRPNLPPPYVSFPSRFRIDPTAGWSIFSYLFSLWWISFKNTSVPDPPFPVHEMDRIHQPGGYSSCVRIRRLFPSRQCL